MYRPWWFPERNPKQQKIRDRMLAIVFKEFERYNYQHIRTPAVEPVEILKKGGDIIDQQVYGLYGLAQWPEDTKDYALHFDLTVPLARYVLDHTQDIVFPFSRYQAQPVWRWESHKRGRYKEFRQCDIDTIRRSETNVWQWYDAQSIIVMESAMKAVCSNFNLQIDFIAKVSHLALTKSFLSSLWIEWDLQVSALKLLDNYFKQPHDVFATKLIDLVWQEKANQIIAIIVSKDYTKLAHLELYPELEYIMKTLESAWIAFEYDICIVRGQNYYSGMVVEWMDRNDMAMGSLAAWWRYDNLTNFIDPKQSFSGVGTSLWRFTSLVMEKVNSTDIQDSYLFINFDNISDNLKLARSDYFLSKTVEFYPVNAKLGKQFEYADKKAMKYAVLFWESEKNWWYFIVKDLVTWEQISETVIIS
jgi:histidyl-tRNA synthetase